MKTLLQKDVDIIVMSDDNEKEDDTLLFWWFDPFFNLKISYLATSWFY